MSQQSPKKTKDPGVIVVKKMRDYSKDPNVKKHAEKAKAFLEKNHLPEDLKNK